MEHMAYFFFELKDSLIQFHQQIIFGWGLSESVLWKTIGEENLSNPFQFLRLVPENILNTSVSSLA